VTGDEANYYQYGINILKRHPQKDVVNGVPLYNSQMPIVAINALPRAIQQLSTPSLKTYYGPNQPGCGLFKIFFCYCCDGAGIVCMEVGHRIVWKDRWSFSPCYYTCYVQI
jgi:hypothetical protein